MSLRGNAGRCPSRIIGNQEANIIFRVIPEGTTKHRQYCAVFSQDVGIGPRIVDGLLNLFKAEGRNKSTLLAIFFRQSSSWVRGENFTTYQNTADILRWKMSRKVKVAGILIGIENTNTKYICAEPETCFITRSWRAVGRRKLIGAKEYCHGGTLHHLSPL